MSQENLPMEIVFRETPILLDTRLCCGQKVPLISTPGAILTIPGPEQAAQMVDYYVRNREHLTPWEPERMEEFYTSQGWKRRLRANLLDYKHGRAVRMAAFATPPRGPKRPDASSLDGCAVIGVCNLNNVILGVLQACDMGYSIDHGHEGKGLMREILAGSLAWAFKVMDLHRVRAGYIPENFRSARVLSKLGFQLEGYSQSFLRINGAWRDHVQTSLLNPWEDPGRPSCGMPPEEQSFPFNFYSSLQDDLITLVSQWRENPDFARGRGAAYHFAILDRSTGRYAGAISLRFGDSERIRTLTGNIGYSVEPDFRGNSYAARACKLLRTVALNHGVTKLWLTCDPENKASSRVCEKIGAKLAAVTRIPADDDLAERGSPEKASYCWELL